MKFLPKNTLAYFQAAPQFKPMNVGQTPIKTLAAATKQYRTHCGTVSPDDEAVEFYAINHCAAIVKKNFTLNEPLPGWAKTVMDEYLSMATEQGLRMLHYLYSITVRECRHIKIMDESFWTDTIAKKHGIAVAEFVKTQISPSNEDMAVKAYMDSKSMEPAVKLAEAVRDCFYKGKWHSGYGGKAWGKVSDCLVAFLKGETSMEAMVDTAYTLAHNNGPIFNKGMMYSHYSGEFITILDVQRSGQIPEMLMDSVDYGLKRPERAKIIVQATAKNCPEEFGPFLDWKKVKDLGAVHNHESKYQLQLKHHGEGPGSMSVINGWKVKKLAPWHVFPGETVATFERVKA